jgi:cyanophycin synthetase
VVLRNNANLSTGGTATDVTDDVHPEVAARAVAAAQMIGLDICGVDVVCDSVLKPLEEQNGGIVEVNAAPGLRMHLAPSFGKAARWAKPSSPCVAAGDDGRIPVVAVTGTNGKTTTVRLIAHLLTASGLRTGMTNTDGVYIEGRQIDSGDCSGPRSARNVLLHPDVDAAVFETARGGILREGLAFDRCQVAVVTNIGAGDHLGLNYITTVEDLAVLKRVIVQNVADSGMAVLNAADPMVAHGPNCPGKVIFFAADRDASRDGHAPRAGQPRRLRGRRPSWRRRARSARDRPVAGTDHAQRRHRLPGRERHGLGGRRLGRGPDWKTIALGLATFANEADNAPGRFNVFDYGRHPDRRLRPQSGRHPGAGAGRGSMPAKRRSVVISGAGDRRDEDIRQQTEILGAAFDDVLLYQDPASAAAPTAKWSRCCARAWTAPRAPAISRKSTASSSPSTPPWRACSPATCA